MRRTGHGSNQIAHPSIAHTFTSALTEISWVAERMRCGAVCGVVRQWPGASRWGSGASRLMRLDFGGMPGASPVVRQYRKGDAPIEGGQQRAF